MKELYATANESSMLCVELDGPTGSYHIPKKQGFKLAQISNKQVILVNIYYSQNINLHRWDQHVIPLAFTKIQFSTQVFGSINDENLKNLNTMKQKVQEIL